MLFWISFEATPCNEKNTVGRFAVSPAISVIDEFPGVVRAHDFSQEPAGSTQSKQWRIELYSCWTVVGQFSDV